MIVAAALWLAPALAAAQGGEVRPVEPNTDVEAALDGSYEAADPTEGGQLGAAVGGRWSPHPAFELGAAWGARASWASLSGGASRARFGAAPLRAWVGTGGVADAWRLGLRLEGGVGLQALDAAVASSNGERAFAQLSGEVGWVGDGVSVRLSVRAGFAWSGAFAYAGVGAAGLGLELGRPGWIARPFLVARGLVATDLGWAAVVEAGALVPLADHALRFVVATPTAPTGQLFTIRVEWRAELGDP